MENKKYLKKIWRKSSNKNAQLAKATSDNQMWI